MEREYPDLLVREDLSEVDPDTDLIIGFEEERQAQVTQRDPLLASYHLRR